MKDHYIVCGEEAEPTWDTENNEVQKFNFHDAHENARERAEETPGERFHVYRAVSWTEAPIGEPVTTPTQPDEATERVTGPAMEGMPDLACDSGELPPAQELRRATEAA
ncbi:hypothetical protein AUC70_11735 [Methyloceanibacter stevinii]|uniref:Uncharacterized protein n=1 Tax=Methyloceanibacter stevinii TaxID=1774970 RepID=A0A1E3VJ31_9HYPH|nr:hypothetical protein [Methyloceanibacter stevinii]ODR93529.1 hypothetical protein AUC70_11735 [Methyloceanibacter stevinii]